MTGLRGEAAIVGIAELPAEKKQSAPPSFTLDQYARLAKMVIEDAGVEPSVVNGLSTHGIAESDMFAPATLSEYLGLPLDFGDRVDLGGATAAGMVWRAAAAVELGQCDAVLVVMPGSTEIPRSEAKPGRTPELVRRVEQQLRLPAGRVRDPLRQRRTERPVCADRPALCGRIRLRRRRVGHASRCISGRTRVPIPAPCSTASRSRSTTC